ncbi:MAG TPA: nucleotidyltransferase family protein [Longimicrobiaceae bacterium]|nr:nucleotidyltransferase family protein [Longimicrobiaceae bacterium]
MSTVAIQIPHQRIADFCREHRIRRLRLFGSVLRDDFRSDSDVDILVEFEPGTIVGLITLAALEIELGGIIGRKVDLRTPNDLSRYFRQQVLDSATVLYAA